MTPEEILKHVRQLIAEHAGGDPDRWFYANRYVFARLQLDERATKTDVKERLLDANSPCHGCGKHFDSRKDVCLHRLDGKKGYSDKNGVLMHGECHRKFHSRQKDDSSGEAAVGGVLVRRSRQYGGSFSLWWDITPRLKASLHKYDVIQFSKKDTDDDGRLVEWCLVPTAMLLPRLTPDRQQSLGEGNWSIKVRRGHENEIAIAPGKGKKDWDYLPVTWLGPEDED